MPRARQRVLHGRLQLVGNFERGLPRGDVVFHAADGIERLTDAAQINAVTGQIQAVFLNQLIVQIELAQVKRVHDARHARDIGIPEQHIECRWRLSIEVVVNEYLLIWRSSLPQ